MAAGLSTIEREAISEQQRHLARLHIAKHDVHPFYWTWWMRLSWPFPIVQTRAEADLKAWTTNMHRSLRAAGVFGIHNDADRLHAHGVLYVPGPFKRAYPSPDAKCLLGLSRMFHERHWDHGSVKLERYDYQKAISEQVVNRIGYYIAKDPGGVMCFGRAPLYKAEFIM